MFTRRIMKKMTLSNFSIGEGEPLTVICGPCIIEGEEETLFWAEELKKIFRPFPVNLIFKASYDKANRSSIHSFRGPGLELGLHILSRVRQEVGLPVLTDVHSPQEALAAAATIDILQIPAFLCRQTDLVVAAASAKRPINIKKGQFVSPWDMKNVVEKIESTGNEQILLTDRGTCFGYNNLITDLRAIPIMKQHGYPVCFDASHSVQLPGGVGPSSGGEREFIPTLAKGAIAAGCNALFLEAHPNPGSAKSDPATVFPFQELPKFLEMICRLYEAVWYV